MNPFKDQSDLNLTEGGITRPLLYLSFPIIITNLMQTTYNLADTLWLGQYSTISLAAISYSFPMVFLVISIGMGVSVTGSVLVAQYTGADKPRKAEYAASQTAMYAIIAGLIIGAIAYVTVGPILGLIGATGDVHTQATSYMQYISSGLVFMFGFSVFIALLRGYGDTITPMLVMGASVVVNIILDPFLIYGWWMFPELGIEGAAIATVFSRMLAFFTGVVILFTGTRGLTISIQNMKPSLGYFRKMVFIGGPASLESTARAISVNLMLVLVSMFPTTVVAGYGVATRILSLVFMPAIAVGRGVETMTGQNIGAGKPDRAEKTNNLAAKLVLVVLTVFGVLTLLVNRPMVSLFTSDPEVIEIGVEFFKYVALTFGGVGVVRAYMGGFRGAGKTTIAAVISIMTLGVIRLSVAFGTVGWFQHRSIWIGFAASNVFGAVLAFLLFRTGTWKQADVVSETKKTTTTSD